MPLLDDSRLEKCATAIVERFFAEKTALTEGVADVAEEGNFNPEQVKRLVEAVNNMTFLRKFEGSDDRMAASEFQPADANAAISRMIDAARELIQATGSAPPPESGDAGLDLPVTRPEAPAPLEEPAPPEAEEPKLSSAKMTMKLQKTAELLHDEKYQARVDLTDTFQKLATDFTRVGGTPFEAFEKDAFYKWGERAAPFLNTLRTSLRLPQANYDHTAMIKVARIVDSRQPEMRRFQELMVQSERAKKAEQGLQRVKDYLKDLKQ